MKKRTDNMTPEELEKYHDELFVRCCKRYGRYSFRCENMEYLLGLPLGSFKNRIPLEDMLERLGTYSIEQLEKFPKKMKKLNYVITDFEYRFRPGVFSVPVDEWGWFIVDSWDSLKRKATRAKKTVIRAFKRSEQLPIKSTTESHPTEFSCDKLPEHVVPDVIKETEKKNEQSLKSKITGLFKKSPPPLDYPISEKYEGPLYSTQLTENIQDIPLSHAVLLVNQASGPIAHGSRKRENREYDCGMVPIYFAACV